jgi:DNA-binding response OmpR family regulator
MNHILDRPLAPAALEDCRLKPASSYHILYVENDLELRSLSAKALLKSGYRVDVAEDGQSGWEAICHGSYDLLITDNQMPRLTGLELVKRVWSAGLTLPVVMASGSFSAFDARRDPWLPIAAILQKPFAARQLLETIEEVLYAGNAVQKRDKLFSPGLDEAFAHCEQVRDWGINE